MDSARSLVSILPAERSSALSRRLRRVKWRCWFGNSCSAIHVVFGSGGDPAFSRNAQSTPIPRMPKRPQSPHQRERPIVRANFTQPTTPNAAPSKATMGRAVCNASASAYLMNAATTWSRKPPSMSVLVSGLTSVGLASLRPDKSLFMPGQGDGAVTVSRLSISATTKAYRSG